MFFTALKIVISVSVISFASWLSKTKPEIAGIVTVLPLVSILAIAFSYGETKDLENTAIYARSILLAVPISWMFFLPFFFVGKIEAPFWAFYVSGIVLTAVAFVGYKAAISYFS